MSTGHSVLFTTFADEADALRVVRTLVEERLIACGTLLPGARSIYRWGGEVKQATEVVVMMKSRSDLFDAVAARVQTLHPYETPELVALPVLSGLPAYLRWIDSETVARTDEK